MEELLPGKIIFNIDVMLAKRKMSVTELADKVGITIANMSILKRKSQSDKGINPDQDLPRAGLPARRYIGIPRRVI